MLILATGRQNIRHDFDRKAFGGRRVSVINYETTPCSNADNYITEGGRKREKFGSWNAFGIATGLLAVQLFHYLCLTRRKKTRGGGGGEGLLRQETRFLRDWYASKRQEFNKLSTSHCSPYYMKLITQLLTNISYSFTKRSWRAR